MLHLVAVRTFITWKSADYGVVWQRHCRFSWVSRHSESEGKHELGQGFTRSNQALKSLRERRFTMRITLSSSSTYSRLVITRQEFLRFTHSRNSELKRKRVKWSGPECRWEKERKLFKGAHNSCTQCEMGNWKERSGLERAESQASSFHFANFIAPKGAWKICEMILVLLQQWISHIGIENRAWSEKWTVSGWITRSAQGALDRIRKRTIDAVTEW